VKASRSSATPACIAACSGMAFWWYAVLAVLVRVLWISHGTCSPTNDAYLAMRPHRQNLHFFERVVGQFASISFHTMCEKYETTQFPNLYVQLLTGEQDLSFSLIWLHFD
jgi:hypothetical protein